MTQPLRSREFPGAIPVGARPGAGTGPTPARPAVGPCLPLPGTQRGPFGLSSKAAVPYHGNDSDRQLFCLLELGGINAVVVMDGDITSVNV